ncbi:FmdB family zinc ribbon protein [Ruania zhangjianzhongii]|uniref:FmdB family zinc ribbon protein n=1 Tax=Ruania zhangjianzhongii TaxID=2603206 RepID=UPI0011CC2126|nr:FmdB family zinc ribbon protein [Ruania zhangjianzhongii]
MPTYAYACSQCSHRFDIYQSFTEDALTICPECAQQSLRKVYSSVGVVFKGSGFYRNDSRSSESSSSPAAKSESTSEGKTESKSESTTGSGSDAKPATKSSEKSGSSAAPAKAAASS